MAREPHCKRCGKDYPVDWPACPHCGEYATSPAMLTSNQWVSLAERQPPKDCARLLVTNNITARDAYDHFCHLWLVHMVHKQDDGSFAAFDDHDRKIHGLTHWRYAVPEESSVETTCTSANRETVKYLDHLAGCIRNGLHGDDAGIMRMTANDADAVQRAADLLRPAIETACCIWTPDEPAGEFFFTTACGERGVNKEDSYKFCPYCSSALKTSALQNDGEPV